MKGNWGLSRLALTPLNKRLSPERLDRLRDQRLRWLVQHAEQTMPFYSHLLIQHGVDPKAVHGFKDLAKLPIITKPMLREAGESAWAKDIDPRRLMKSFTSGSSGEPLTVPETRLDRAFFHAVNFDSMAIWGWRPWHRGLALGSQAMPAPHPLWRLGLFRWPRVDTALPVTEWLASYEGIRPHAMHSYPSALREFCFEARSRGGLNWKPRLLTVGGEMFPDDLRPLVREVFGQLPYVMYGANEGGRLAIGCSEHRGLHVRPDAVHFELMRDGKPVPPGETGTVYITALLNSMIPLIRYELGDLAAWIPGQCACGLWWPRLDMQKGRMGDMVPLPGGRKVAITTLGGIVGRSKAVRQYQFVSPHPGELVLVYEAVRPGDAIEEGIIKKLDKMLPGIVLRSEVTGQLPRTGSGKVRYYIPSD